MKNTLFLSAVLLGLFLSSCKKESLNSTPTVDLYQENLKLVDTNATFYFVADVEGISGVNKIIIQQGVSNADLHVPSSCELPSDLYKLTFSNNQGASIVISLWDSIYDGNYDLNRNEHKPFFFSFSDVHNVAGIGFLLNNETFTCAATGAENAAYYLDKFYNNYHLTARFKYCALKDYPATKTVYLKNAVCKFW